MRISSAVPRRLSPSKKSSVPLGYLSRKVVSSTWALGQSFMKKRQVALRKERTAFMLLATSPALSSSSWKSARASLYFFSSKALSAAL